MKINIALALLAILLPSFISAKEPEKGFSLDSLQVLKISGQDQRAVVKMPAGKMTVLKQGDVLQAGDKKKQLPEVRVVEITAGRIVLEEKKSDEVEKIIIRHADGKQTMERIRRTGETSSPAFVSATVPVISSQSATDSGSR